MTSKRSVTPRRKQQRGSAMVEGALCIMAFMFLSLGVCEFAMAVYAYDYVAAAAADGARYAATHGSASADPADLADVQRIVRSRAVALISSRLTVRGNPLLVEEGEPPQDSVWAQENGVANNDPGSTVTVRVTYEVTPLVGLALGNATTVSSSSQMYISH
jgi:Flp pilus assembly protein TadG